MSNIMEGSIELSKDESTGIATICINNPRKRNAIDGHMMQQLSDTISHLENWNTGKAVIVYGKNGFFSSGVDLTFLAQTIDKAANGPLYSGKMVSILTRLKALPLLSVAIIDGMALGGGAEVAAACDMRVMARSAKIGFVQICIGVSTAWSGGCRLVQICGFTKALDLLLSGRVITATEALDIGFANHLVDNTSEQLINDSTDWLKQFIYDDQAQIIQIKNYLSMKSIV